MQPTTWKLYLVLQEIVTIGHWEQRTEYKIAWSQVCRARGRQWSILARHVYPEAFLSGFKSQDRSQRVRGRWQQGQHRSHCRPVRPETGWGGLGSVGGHSHSIHRHRDSSSLGGGASHSKEIRPGPRWGREECWSLYPPLRRDNVSLFPH